MAALGLFRSTQAEQFATKYAEELLIGKVCAKGTTRPEEQIFYELVKLKQITLKKDSKIIARKILKTKLQQKRFI